MATKGSSEVIPTPAEQNKTRREHKAAKRRNTGGEDRLTIKDGFLVGLLHDREEEAEQARVAREAARQKAAADRQKAADYRRAYHVEQANLAKQNDKVVAIGGVVAKKVAALMLEAFPDAQATEEFKRDESGNLEKVIRDGKSFAVKVKVSKTEVARREALKQLTVKELKNTAQINYAVRTVKDALGRAMVEMKKA